MQIVAGNRAGAITILLDTRSLYGDREALDGQLKPTHIVTSLSDIPVLLQAQYSLAPPNQLAPQTLPSS